MVCNPIIRCIIFTFYVRNLKCSVFLLLKIDYYFIHSFISLFIFIFLWYNALHCNAKVIDCTADWFQAKRNYIIKLMQNDDVKLTCKYESENAKISIVTTAQLLEINYACVCVSWVRKVLRVVNKFGLADVVLFAWRNLLKLTNDTVMCFVWKKNGVSSAKTKQKSHYARKYSGLRHMPTTKSLVMMAKTTTTRITIRI